MKKVLSFILALTLLISAANVFALPVFGEEIVGESDDVGEETEPISEAAEPLSNETAALPEQNEDVQSSLPLNDNLPTEEPSEEIVTLSFNSGMLQSNDELFEQYVTKLLYGGNEFMLFASERGRSQLSGRALEIYDAIKPHILAIASGKEISTIIPCNNAFDLADENLFYNVYNALIMDCPSEFYWLDTRSGVSFSNYDIAFCVADGYHTDKKIGNKYCEVDPSKIKAANRAIENAKEICRNAKGTEYQKLEYFKQKICDLVEYDYDAAANNKSLPDRGPWNLIYVFDGNENTNVVCQGYSLAFQYLCELSGIECYCILGEFNGGYHMWNHVRLDGKMYFVDVTSCDSNNKSFLRGYTEYYGDGYTIQFSDYKFSPVTLNLFSEDILKLSNSDYSGASHEHRYSDEWESDNDYHWHEALCQCDDAYVITNPHRWDPEKEKIIKKASCTEKGKKTQTCSVCEKTITVEIPVTEHEYSDAWKFDETGHWHECECGEKTAVEAHTPKEVIDTMPTEESNGVGHDECEVCGFVTNEGKVIPPNHIHVMEKVPAKLATCVEEGNIEHYTCTKCHKNFSDEAGENEIGNVVTEKDPANHTGGTRIDGKLDPKCSEEGYTGDTVCTGCETVITKGEVIPPTGEHEEVIRDAKEADCANEGYTGDTVCADCGAVIIKGEVIPPDKTKHDYQWVVDKEADFENTGLKHEECTRCHDIRNENTVIPIPICEHSAMQHFDKVNSTCKKQGTREYWYCSECNRKYSDEKGMLLVNSEDELLVPVDPENHINTEIRDIKSATCSSEGYTGDKYCTDCNTLIASGSTLAINPDGHSFVNNKCEYCGKIQATYYPPTFTYIDDETHLAGGNIRSHVPDSMTMHTDGVYEWNYCLYCQHEYGRVPVAEVDINIDDSVDLVADDPVQSTDDGDDIDVDDNTGDNTGADVTEPEDSNPPTGIAIALLPMALAAAAASLVRKK